MSLKSRISTKELKGGKKEVTVLDPNSGRVVAQYTTSASGADADVRRIKEDLERKAHQVEVTEK